MADKKITKGIKFIKIKFGIYDNVKTIGKKTSEFIFLKNSISSNKFRITPKQIKTSIQLIKTLQYPVIK